MITNALAHTSCWIWKESS